MGPGQHSPCLCSAMSYPTALGSHGGARETAGSNEAKGRHRGEAMSDAPQNAVGSSVPARRNCFVPPLMPPRSPHGSAPSLHWRRCRTPLGPTLVQRSKAGWRDEGHSPKDALPPPGQGTEGCPKPGCPIPQRTNIPHVPRRRGGPSVPGGERRRMKKASDVRWRQSSPAVRNPAQALPYSPATAH